MTGEVALAIVQVIGPALAELVKLIEDATKGNVLTADEVAARAAAIAATLQGKVDAAQSELDQRFPTGTP